MGLAGLTLGSLAFSPLDRFAQEPTGWQVGQRYGRVCLGRVDIRSRPSADAPSVKVIYDDATVVWQKEVISGAASDLVSKRWVETPDGYIFAPRLQPTKYLPNTPVSTLPEVGGKKGMWVEVTVPYADIILNGPSGTAWLKEAQYPRLYYGMVVWVDEIKTSTSGKILYRVNERYGNPGDVFWVEGETMRPITEEEISPINPNVENKKVVINLIRQTMTCYEGNDEVFFCRVSTGAKFDAEGNPVDKWSTPVGPHPIYRKLLSLHMSGPTTGDWPAVAWTSIFATGGVAIHSTYWHNEYGVPRSHGCVNCLPEDAKWVWRWTYPHVAMEPGDLDISNQWPPTGTIVEVTE